MKVSALMVGFNAVSHGQIGPGELDAIEAALPVLDCEVVVVDNGSEDSSREVMAGWPARYSFFVLVAAERRLPYVEALGRAAAAASGDLFLIVDIDEANQVLELPGLVKRLDGHDCVHGLRASRPWSRRRVTSLLFNFFYRRVLGHRLRDIGHNHYLMPRSSFAALMDRVERFRLAAFPFAIELGGIDVVQVPVPSAPAGRTSYRPGRRLRYLARVVYDVVRVAALRVRR